jgi:hypothetical protein
MGWEITMPVWNRTPTPNAPAVLNSWLLAWGDPRPQVSPYSPNTTGLLADRLMRLAQVGYQARRIDPDAPPSTLFMPEESHATVDV